MNRPLALLGLTIAAASLRLAPTTVAARSTIATVPATQSWTLQRTRDGQPDFHGYWTNDTFTPLERPPELAGKEFFTQVRRSAVRVRLPRGQLRAPEHPPWRARAREVEPGVLALVRRPRVSRHGRDLANRAPAPLAYVRHMPGTAGGRTMNTERQVRLFRNGRNQALRIPRDLELPGSAATLRKEGPRLIVEPVAGPSLLAVLAKLKPLDEEFPPISRLPAEPVEF